MITITTADARHVAASRASAPAPLVNVVHGEVSMRESLELLIERSGVEAETYASAHDFLERPDAPGPSCVILDVALPDLNGLELQSLLARDQPAIAVIFVTGSGDIRTSVQAMKAGAVEYLTRPFRDDALMAAVEQGLERSRRALEQEARVEALRERFASLTPREREVMVLVVAGLLNKQVGGELSISEITVKAHRGQVMRKMKAGSLPALVNMASTLGARVG
jgi:FixJ family two-component response regulator